MFIRVFTTFIIYLAVLFQGESAAEDQKATVIKLKNDMKVVLKKTTFDPGEIYVYLTAAGGYASFPLKDIPAARLASQTALESGFQEITADHFFSEEIELSIEILPYGRSIEGFAEIGEFNKLLDYIARYFKIRKFTPEAFKIAKSAALKIQQGTKYDHEATFQDEFLDLNTQHFALMNPIKAKDIDHADIHVAEEVFKEMFGKPDEFVVVIVGDFDEKNIAKKLEGTLGLVPKIETHINFTNSPIPVFPAKIQEKEIPAYNQKKCLARVTYPLKKMNAAIFAMRNFFEAFLEKRIGERLKKAYGEDFGIEALFENPIFPRADFPLLVIQYVSEAYQVKKVEALILEEIQQLCKRGITQSEFDKFKNEFQNKDPFWLRDNEFWIDLLTNYHVLQWEMKESVGTKEEISQITLEQMTMVLREIINKDIYTFLYSRP